MEKKRYISIARPLKSKTSAFNQSIGRNHKGRITAWHRGGGHTKLYRKIDFERKNTHGIVIGLEYDPNRAAFIARVFNPDTKEHNYVLAPAKMQEGDIIRSNSRRNGLQNGHSKTLRYISTGSLVYNLNAFPDTCGKYLRAPGASGKIAKRTEKLAKIRLKSGQFKWFDIKTMAVNGVVSNPNHRFKKLFKAGQTRWLGRRPTVRGVAMNPVDHPHGGGEGKTSGGQPSVTPWGKPTKGFLTNRKKNL